MQFFSPFTVFIRGSMLPWLLHNFIKWKRTALVFFAFAVVLFTYTIPTVFAQEDQLAFEEGIEVVDNTIALSGTDIRVIIARIINVALGLIGIVLLVLILYGGFLWMTAGGDDDKVAQGKKVIVNAVIGLAIVLSAFAIARFVLNKLGEATGAGRNAGENDGRPPIRNFVASGALGKIIEDHYPFRDQEDVSRNTRISVTFVEPILPQSLIINANGSCWGENGPTVDPAVCQPQEGEAPLAYYGDCLSVDGQTVCDRLATSSVYIHLSNKSGQPNDIDTQTAVEAYVRAVYDANRNAQTFTFIPLQSLGSHENNLWYTVELTNSIKRNVRLPGVNGDEVQNFVGAFDNDFDKKYIWDFKTNTEEDITPPTVSRVYPNTGSTVARNTIVSLTFSEAIDPTTADGVLGPSSTFHSLIFGSEVTVRGRWRVTNENKTVEFVSDFPCGLNSCGEPMYCLPVGCEERNANCSSAYETLARSAEPTADPDDPEFRADLGAVGITDMAGNRLDIADGVSQPHRQIPNNFRTIGAEEKQADNYFWAFRVANTVDRAAPYIEVVTPSLDEQNIEENAPLHVQFSKLMWLRTLQNITVEEYPANIDAGDGQPLRTLWKRVRATDEQEKTKAIVNHREFGPNDLDLYYFSSVPGTVRSVTQNCLYPGRGPWYDDSGNGGSCRIEYNEDGSVRATPGCIQIDESAENLSANDTGCARSIGMNEGNDALTVATVEECLNTLRTPEVSPRRE